MSVVYALIVFSINDLSRHNRRMRGVFQNKAGDMADGRGGDGSKATRTELAFEAVSGAR